MAEGTPISVLVLGASYGLLPATRIALAGHDVTVVCRAEEGARIASDGVAVTLPERGTAQASVLGGARPMTLRCDARIGEGGSDVMGFVTPDRAEPEQADLIILAMQEPQIAAPEIAELSGRIAASGVPVLSLQNMPPPPFLERIGLDPERVSHAYSSRDVWAGFPAHQFTLASPDAQAVRMDPEKPGELTITLATNFKVAPFADISAQKLLERIAADTDASCPQGRSPSVRIVATSDLYTPLAKWPMLISGNCRCMRVDAAPVSIAEAVHADFDASRAIYNWTADLAHKAGAPRDVLVPFERYADVAKGLTLPSSLARGLAAGAPAVERIDLLLAAIARDVGHPVGPLAEITDLIDRQLTDGRCVA